MVRGVLVDFNETLARLSSCTHFIERRSNAMACRRSRLDGVTGGWWARRCV